MDAFLVAFIIVITVLYLVQPKYIKIKSEEDGKTYLVLPYTDADIAAEYLAKINENIGRLIRKLKLKYGRQHFMVGAIADNYNPDVLVEHFPSFRERHVAFTKNKGDEIHICIRSPKGELEDFNTVMFVSLHELAHISIEPYGHPEEFWIAFRWILREAVYARIYEPVNYFIHPVYYHKEHIEYTPLFDKSIEKY